MDTMPNNERALFLLIQNYIRNWVPIKTDSIIYCTVMSLSYGLKPTGLTEKLFKIYNQYLKNTKGRILLNM